MKNYLKVIGVFLCMISVKSMSAQDTSLKLTESITKGTKHEVAMETIDASNKVAADTRVHYEAGKSVTLKPGFVAQSGSVFKASIGKPEAAARVGALYSESADKVSMYAYPNPFSETPVEIQYSLPKASKVTLSISNILGVTIATLVDNQDVSEGNHTVKYSGESIPTGSYFYTLKTDTGVISKKLSKK
jgi:hypothetical protein